MKRSRIGAVLLVFLLAASWAVTWAMSAIHRPVMEELKLAEVSALAQDWEQAGIAVDMAEAGWKKWRRFRSCFADQTPVEKIDAQFARLRHCQEEELSALAAETAQMVGAMGDSHSLTWWNFF